MGGWVGWGWPATTRVRLPCGAHTALLHQMPPYHDGMPTAIMLPALLPPQVGRLDYGLPGAARTLSACARLAHQLRMEVLLERLDLRMEGAGGRGRGWAGGRAGVRGRGVQGLRIGGGGWAGIQLRALLRCLPASGSGRDLQTTVPTAMARPPPCASQWAHTRPRCSG